MVRAPPANQEIRLVDEAGAYTDFVKLQRWHWRYWHLLAGTDTAGVIDNGATGIYGSRMFLFNGRNRKKIYGSWTFYKHYLHIGTMLLAFIQRYYPTDKSFANEREMLQYLAGKAAGPWVFGRSRGSGAR
jgi:hypothetical protein